MHLFERRKRGENIRQPKREQDQKETKMNTNLPLTQYLIEQTVHVTTGFHTLPEVCLLLTTLQFIFSFQEKEIATMEKLLLRKVREHTDSKTMNWTSNEA